MCAKCQCPNLLGHGNKTDEANKLRLILTGLETDRNKRRQVHEGGVNASPSRARANILVRGKDVAKENVVVVFRLKWVTNQWILCK